jgi:hypothetical protein
MRSTHSFETEFLIRRCKEDKTTAFIYLRITIDEERAELSLKEQIKVADWDSRTKQVRGNSVQVKALNQYMEDVKFKVKLKHRMLLDKEALITAETVKLAIWACILFKKGTNSSSCWTTI